MSTFTGTAEQLGDTIEKGLRVELKALIKKKLIESVDQVIEDMAIQIAENIVIQAESIRMPFGNDGFGPETRVVINFNLKKPPMMYDSKTKEVKERTVLDR